MKNHLKGLENDHREIQKHIRVQRSLIWTQAWARRQQRRFYINYI